MKLTIMASIGLLAFTSLVAAQTNPSVQVSLPGYPFGVAVTQDQQWIFVSLIDKKGAIAVLQNTGKETRLVRTVPAIGTPAGMVLTHSGDMLITAAGNSVVFFDTRRLESGEKDPDFQRISDSVDAGSFYANVTSDDKTLFVSDEFAGTITVIDLDKVRSLGHGNPRRGNAPGRATDAIIGKITVGTAPIALTFSKEERWLFTTSQSAAPSWKWPRTLKAEMGTQMVPQGAVVVIDVAKARVHPEDSVYAKVPAGGSPVRSTLSPDGKRLFVSARNSNAVLVFDTADLISDPDHAKPIKVPVGSSPVPVVVVKDGKFALAGNSNRFAANAGANSTLTVLDTSRIGTQLDPHVGEIPCGAFPREFCPGPDGRTLFLTNYRSRTLQVIDVDQMIGLLAK